jgi:hypothetical protein
MEVEIMTEVIGHQILIGLIETRKFFDQISLLIRTTEDLLRDEGWEPLLGNKCADLSAHLYRPKKWMPREIYRFFIVSEDGEENRDMVIFTGVLLDVENAWGGFQEPWVTCGLYQFNTEKFDVTKFGYWDWVRAHLDDKHDADGIFHEYKCSPEEQEEWEGLVYQATSALPLTAIDSAQALKQKLIEPLLQKVSKH